MDGREIGDGPTGLGGITAGEALLDALLDFFPRVEKPGVIDLQSSGAKQEPITWAEVFGCAGLLGVEPWDFTLAELKWMWKAKEEMLWDHTAWLAYHSMLPHVKKGQMIDVDTFNPIKQAMKRVNINLLDGIIQNSKLPDRLTNEEKEEKWNKYLSTLEN